MSKEEKTPAQEKATRLKQQIIQEIDRRIEDLNESSKHLSESSNKSIRFAIKNIESLKQYIEKLP